MVERFTISMPDELFKRLQEVKQEMNVSGICQEALDREITLAELRQKGSKTMSIEDAKARLHKEKETQEKQSFDEGFKQGKEAALKTSYEEMKAIADCVEFMGSSDARNLKATECISKDLLELVFPDGVLTAAGRDRDFDPAFEAESFLEGYFKGVAEFYEEVKDEL